MMSDERQDHYAAQNRPDLALSTDWLEMTVVPMTRRQAARLRRKEWCHKTHRHEPGVRCGVCKPSSPR